MVMRSVCPFGMNINVERRTGCIVQNYINQTVFKCIDCILKEPTEITQPNGEKVILKFPTSAQHNTVNDSLSFFYIFCPDCFRIFFSTVLLTLMENF